jgi:hypothetical protein
VQAFRLLHPHPDRVDGPGGVWTRRGRDLVSEPGVYLVRIESPVASVRAVAVGVTVGESLRSSGLLAHEAVDPRAVTRRTRALRRARVDREPVLLTHSGGCLAVSAAARSARPLFRVEHGGTSVAVELVPPADAELALADLGRRAVLVADGHHRLAAAAAHARSCPVAGAGATDDGGGRHDCARVTALVIDGDDTPLMLDPIHRLLQRRTPGALRAGDLLAALPGLTEPIPVPVRPGGSGDDRPSREAGHHVVLADRSGELSVPCPPRPHEALPTTAHVVESAIAALAGATVRRIPDAGRVTSAAARRGTVGILMPPVSLADVLDTVAVGLLMPVKATSFRPKVPAGLLVRPLTSHW